MPLLPSSLPFFTLNPITRKRLQRFREMRRAWYSLWILIILYTLSLGAELISNDKPLYLRYEGNSYFPFLFYYADDTFTGSGRFTRTDYKALNNTSAFADNEHNFMVFPIIPYGPQEIIATESIEVPDDVTVSMRAEPHVATVNVSADGVIQRHRQAQWFFPDYERIKGVRLATYYPISDEFMAAIEQRFDNVEAASFRQRIDSNDHAILLSLTPYSSRSRAPRSVRIRLEEVLNDTAVSKAVVKDDGSSVHFDDPVWQALSPDQREKVNAAALERTVGAVAPVRVVHDDTTYLFSFDKEDVLFPFRPVQGHPFGIDNAGRDVLSRVFYALRTSLNFGLLLVAVAMLLGTLAGAIQGYYGGKIDLFSQRFTEIWESMPFLYVLILLGSVYGQSFLLLIVVYGIFNWIGISYYMRAEFLRLRTQPYVEAARCLGLPDSKIALKHILPNALVPLITFFPFSLVGAIGTLAALDYLGFGLPAPAPSWGELLSQAQAQPRWWLIFFPASALFIVMLLGVFIGEGIRAAFDPRKFTRLE